MSQCAFICILLCDCCEDMYVLFRCENKSQTTECSRQSAMRFARGRILKLVKMYKQKYFMCFIFNV